MPILTSGRRQSKMPILSRNVDKKLLETEFSIAICCHTGNKWQSKKLFILIFDLWSLIVKSVFDCRLPGVILRMAIRGLGGTCTCYIHHIH